MKKFFSILAILLVLNNSAWAQQQVDLTDVVCQVSESCKKVCQFDIADKFNELSDDQKRLTILCAQDMMQKLNSNQMSLQQQSFAPQK